MASSRLPLKQSLEYQLLATYPILHMPCISIHIYIYTYPMYNVHIYIYIHYIYTHTPHTYTYIYICIYNTSLIYTYMSMYNTSLIYINIIHLSYIYTYIYMHIYPHISKLITYQSQRPLRAAPGLKKVISEVTSDERDICIFIDEQLRSDGIC